MSKTACQTAVVGCHRFDSCLGSAFAESEVTTYDQQAKTLAVAEHKMFQTKQTTFHFRKY